MKRLLLSVAFCGVTFAQPWTNGGITAVLGMNVCGADSGAANAYACPLPNVPSGVTLAYKDGTLYWFKPAHNSTSTTPTLALNGLAAKTIKKQGGAGALASGDLCTTQWAGVTYESVADVFLLQTPTCNAVAGGSGYATVDNNGTALTQRTTLNAIGRGVYTADNSGASTTELRVIDPLTIEGPIIDNFMCGSFGTGTTGCLNWARAVSSSAGTGAETAVAGHPGVHQCFTGSTSGAICTLSLSNSEMVAAADLWETFWIIRIMNSNGSSPTNLTARVGMAGAVGTANVNPPANGVYAEALSTDTDWFLSVCAASSCTSGAGRLDTGVAISNNWPDIDIRRVDANTVGISMNGGAFRCITTQANVPGATTIAGVVITCDGTNKVVNATQIPTVALNPFQMVVNTSTTNEILDADYFLFADFGLSR